MTKILKSKRFAGFADKSGIDDDDLRSAIANAEKGLIDADLGGGVIKQRVPCNNRGKSKGFRTIILIKKGEKAFFVHGFAKNKQANLKDDELIAIKDLAKELLNRTDDELEKLITLKTFMEVSGIKD